MVAAATFPVPGEAQTALVLEVEDGMEGAAEARALAGAVRWSFGPVWVVAESEADSGRNMARSAEGVGEGEAFEGMRIVIPVLGDEAPPALERRGSLDLPSGARSDRLVRSPGVRWAAGMDVDAVARAVEQRAGAILAALVEAGELALPGASTPVYPLRGLSVTATREARAVFSTPFPVTVLGGQEREGMLLSAPADLFRDAPGLDLEGVGGQQRRPVIRGLQGQRILLLADGLRLNNPRRRVESGEPLDMVGPGELARIEVVRGPTSVLYGSDAIGGVVNLVTRSPGTGSDAADLQSELRLGWISAGDAKNGSGQVTGTAGPVSFRLAGGYREAGSYEAPEGEFGEVSFSEPVRVGDTGARDYGGSLTLGYEPAPGHELFARYRGSVATDAGFGYVDPEHFGEGLPTVRILFPRQEFGRQVVGYRGLDLGIFPADRFELTAYRQTNDRTFVTDVHAPLGGTFPPGSFVTAETRSLTDLTSDGFRAEARKLVGEDVVLTYGLDLHRDRSENSDTSTTTMVVGGGEPRVSGRADSRVPDARMRSMGVFAQARAGLGARADLVLGARYQDVRARALDGTESDAAATTDRTVVGAANLFFRVTGELGLIVSVGRGFRSPNLVERFYTGPTPEGRGIWVRNPDLGAETSLNVDLGARYSDGSVEAELFVFRNRIEDGIRLEATGDTVDGAAVHRNVNVDEIRLRGVEAALVAELGGGVAVTGSYTQIEGESRLDPEEVVTGSYGRKLTAALRYEAPSRRFWTEYGVRHQGERDDLVLGGGYVGETIPGFTTHAVRGGVTLPGGQRLTLAVENLTDELYAESMNVGFFRPEPGRHLEVSWTLGF